MNASWDRYGFSSLTVHINFVKSEAVVVKIQGEVESERSLLELVSGEAMTWPLEMSWSREIRPLHLEGAENIYLCQLVEALAELLFQNELKEAVPLI